MSPLRTRSVISEVPQIASGPIAACVSQLYVMRLSAVYPLLATAAAPATPRSTAPRMYPNVRFATIPATAARG